jgi:hypothetical protein
MHPVMNNKRAFIHFTGTIVLFNLLASCADMDGARNIHTLDLKEVDSSAKIFSELAVVRTNRAIEEIASMKHAITHFLSYPTEENRQTLAVNWKSAHKAFLSIGTKPVAEVNLRDSSIALLYQLDAWPIQPGYIDAIEHYPNSGIVNDITVDLSIESIRNQHGFSDVEEIILGFHPLEYLIFSKRATDYKLHENRRLTETDAPRRRNVVLQTEIDNDLLNPILRRRTLLELLGDEAEHSLNQYVVTYLDSLPNPASVEDDQQKGAEMVSRLLTVAHHHAAEGFNESNQLLVSDQSHSKISQTSHMNISLRLNSIIQILNEPVWLSRSLATLDKNIQQDLQTTLIQGALIIEKNEFSESDRARLPIIFSALNHQLEDLKINLANPNS